MVRRSSLSRERGKRCAARLPPRSACALRQISARLDEHRALLDR
jgi:hypothetical protein